MLECERCHKREVLAVKKKEAETLRMGDEAKGRDKCCGAYRHVTVPTSEEVSRARGLKPDDARLKGGRAKATPKRR